MPDQPGRDGVEHPPQGEAARRGHWDDLFLEVGCTAFRQRRQRLLFKRDALGEVGVASPDDSVDEGPIGVEVAKIARAPQQQGVLQRLLQMAMGALDRTVLVGDAAIVARRRHAVMAHQRRVALGDVFARVGRQIAERRRQAVTAMLPGNAAERPQRVLQPFGQRRKAFAAQHDVSVLEAGERQPEVIEPMIEFFARDHDAKSASVGEVG